MADQPPTTGDLFKAKAITNEQLGSAVATYLASGEGTADIGGHRVDVAAAVEAHAPARTALANDATTPAFRRTMVRTAILLTRL